MKTEQRLLIGFIIAILFTLIGGTIAIDVEMINTGTPFLETDTMKGFITALIVEIVIYLIVVVLVKINPTNSK